MALQKRNIPAARSAANTAQRSQGARSLPLHPVSMPLSAAEFALFQDLAQRHVGLNLTAAKTSLVQNRLQRRVLACGCGSYRAYYDRVITPGSEELRICLEALTTNETYFFRHADHWDVFVNSILAGWPRGRCLRVWSAAASSGEEAYSAAIACREHLPSETSAVIEASDINQRVLSVGKNAVYGPYALQKLTDYTRSRWFLPVDDGHWRVKEEARTLVSFRVHNLLDAARGIKQDVIFLRNVLIYFDEPTKLRALDAVTSRLADGGWLFLGGSEALHPSATGFTPVRPQIYRKAQ